MMEALLPPVVSIHMVHPQTRNNYPFAFPCHARLPTFHLLCLSVKRKFTIETSSKPMMIIIFLHGTLIKYTKVGFEKLQKEKKLHMHAIIISRAVAAGYNYSMAMPNKNCLFHKALLVVPTVKCKKTAKAFEYNNVTILLLLAHADTIFHVPPTFSRFPSSSSSRQPPPLLIFACCHPSGNNSFLKTKCWRFNPLYWFYTFPLSLSVSSTSTFACVPFSLSLSLSSNNKIYNHAIPLTRLVPISRRKKTFLSFSTSTVCVLYTCCVLSFATTALLTTFNPALLLPRQK